MGLEQTASNTRQSTAGNGRRIKASGERGCVPYAEGVCRVPMMQRRTRVAGRGNSSADSLPPMSNRLGAAASAYLRSAAHQPIHWYSWSPKAFAAAADQDRPVLLDIGAV